MQVKDMLINPAIDPVEKVKLIDSLCRLGVSYQFKSEIGDQMNQVFNLKLNLDDRDYDLYTVSLVFRVFRQHGFKMSSEVFNKFKNDDGNFKESLANDVNGILSLYEAAHLSLHGEDNLDQALAYTSAQLDLLASQCESHLAKHIAVALQHPFHFAIPRIKSREYISFYEELESHNEVLLKLAKIDFNRVQLLHQQELNEVSRWFEDLKLASRYSYARARIAEIYMWTVAVYFEPQYRRARIILTKIMKLMSIMDDTYDSYATIDELRILIDAIERWDISTIDQLPDYMKFLYNTLLNLYGEFETELESEGRSYGVSYARDALKQMMKAYHIEAEWLNKGYVPSFDEYMENALISCGYHAVAISSFLGMEEIATMEAFEWLKGFPKIDKAAQIICRLMDDITSRVHEQKRNHVATGVECYMKQYGLSEEETVRNFQKTTASAWKDVNEECMRPIVVSMDLLIRFVNLARVIDSLYKGEDKYTNCESLKRYIKSLFFEPIPMEEEAIEAK
ncbi:casbene synthase, chloroplastic-like [Tripterygium wilfordii]|uniref:casbene synthase, chloroplastic-like n=1 Tax=Tripterygium wilfordii TaxID=458696 RepID=UPI0018F7F8AB|nr:casbene synthase, chloroplastic-like [Tripterygium wilfordii]